MSKDKQFQGVSRLLNNMFFIPGLAAWTWLAITTSFMAYQKAIDTFTGEIPHEKIVFAATLVAIFAYLLLDAGISKRLGIYLDHREQKGAKKRFLSIVLIVTIIQLIGTTSASLWIAPDAAEYFTEEHKSHEYINQINQVRFDNNKLLSSAEENIENLMDSADDRIKAAKRIGNNAIQKAINGGDWYQRKSWEEEKFAWIANRKNKDQIDHDYANKIKAAQQYRDSLIAAEKNLIIVAEKNLTTLLQDTTTMASVGIIQAAENTANQKYRSKLSRRTNIVIWADLFALFIGLVSVYISHLDRKSRNKKIDPRTTFLIGTLAISRVGEIWINWLEEFLNIDINGDGWIGNKKQLSKPLKTKDKGSFWASFPFPKPPYDDRTDDSEAYDPNAYDHRTYDPPTQEYDDRTDEKPTKDEYDDRTDDPIYEPNGDENRTCEQCGKIYKYKSEKQRFCENKCRAKYHRESTKGDG